jgi:hypothetical protein
LENCALPCYSVKVRGLYQVVPRISAIKPVVLVGKEKKQVGHIGIRWFFFHIVCSFRERIIVAI